MYMTEIRHSPMLKDVCTEIHQPESPKNWWLLIGWMYCTTVYTWRFFMWTSSSKGASAVLEKPKL